MAKPMKKSTTRKPPEPSSSHAEIVPDLHPIVEHLDELIRKTIPGLRFAVKWKKAYYGDPASGTYAPAGSERAPCCP